MKTNNFLLEVQLHCQFQCRHIRQSHHIHLAHQIHNIHHLNHTRRYRSH